MSRLHARPRGAPSGGGSAWTDDCDGSDDDGADLDLDDDAWPSGAARGPDGSGRGGPAPRGRRRRTALAVAACAAVVVVALSLVRHEQQREQMAVAAARAAQVARADAQAAAWREQQRRSADHARRQLDALVVLPEDLGFQQRLMTRALAAAAPRLPDLDWSTATTRTVRTTAQRLGDGSPRLLDAVRTAQPSADDPGGDAPGAAVPVPAVAGTQVVGLAVGSAPVSTVAWRITTPLTPPQVTDPCAVPGAVVVPDGHDGAPVPACTLRPVTSPSGEQQVVALRSWQRVLDSASGPGDPAGAAPSARVVTIHQAVLLVEQRWTFSVASTAVGAPGTVASVPLLSLDQADLAVRWAADAARGLPTPAPLRGTPLPGFAG